MNFELDDAQRELRDLAAGLLARQVDESRLSKTAATPERFDRELWRDMAASGLVGAAIPEKSGGLGLGVVGAALAAREVGRAVAPVPYAAVATAALTLARFHDAAAEGLLPALADAAAIVVAAPPTARRRLRVDGERVFGAVVGVPWAHIADRVMLGTDDGVVLVDPADAGVTTARGETTNGEIALDLELDGARAVHVRNGDAAHWLREVFVTLLAATQAGVTAQAVRMTADYTSSREQFGRPLSTNQAVALQAADAYVDSTVIDAVALQAAWLLDEGLDAAPAALTAAWWASEGGQHCVHLTQHLHGGTGADVTYPLHRYYLWGKQIELMCGASSSLLAELGAALADRPHAGDALVL